MEERAEHEISLINEDESMTKQEKQRAISEIYWEMQDMQKNNGRYDDPGDDF